MKQKIMIGILLLINLSVNCVMTKKNDIIKKVEIINEATCSFRATVTNLFYSEHINDSKILLTTSDPHFIVDINSVEKINFDGCEELDQYHQFAIHSPIKTFSLEIPEIIGKTFSFQLKKFSSEDNSKHYLLEVLN